jgi:hypothetical protein
MIDQNETLYKTDENLFIDPWDKYPQKVDSTDWRCQEACDTLHVMEELASL